MAEIQHLIYNNAKTCLTMTVRASFPLIFYNLNQRDCSFCMSGWSAIIYQRCGFAAGDQNQPGRSFIHSALHNHLFSQGHEHGSVIAQPGRGVYLFGKRASSAFISCAPIYTQTDVDGWRWHQCCDRLDKRQRVRLKRKTAAPLWTHGLIWWMYLPLFLCDFDCEEVHVFFCNKDNFSAYNSGLGKLCMEDVRSQMQICVWVVYLYTV